MRNMQWSGAVASVLFCASAAIWAQSYPARPVRVVIVFAPAGATDIVGRVAFQKVGEQLNQQFVIDNRPGGGGTIGAALVAKSPADGYTVMVYSATFIATAHMYRSLPYQPLRDFIGVAPVARLVGLLVVNPALPVKSVRELIDYAKARPGKINMASAGAGSTSHLAGIMFATLAGIDVVHVPYKGGGPSVTSVVAGEIGRAHV